MLETHEISELATHELPYLTRRPRTAGENHHLLFIFPEMLQNGQEIAVARKYDCPAEIIFLFHQVESHIDITVRFPLRRAVILVIHFHRLEEEYVTETVELVVKPQPLEMPADEENDLFIQRLPLV